jgi:hypothetical protein
MDRDNSQIFHTVVITELKDPAAKKKVALALARIIKNMPPDKILKRLGALPWTLTRKATPKNATRLSRYLDKVGARTKVTPPLAASVLSDALATQILPDTHLLSQTQVLSTPQDVPEQEPQPDPRFETPPPPPPPPIAPGRKIEPLAASTPKPAPPPPSPPTPRDEGGLDIEPLSLGGMLDRTFQICRTHFWKLLAIIGVWWGFATVLGILVIIIGAITGMTAQSIGKMPLWFLISAIVVLVPVGLVVLIGLYYISQGALIYAVSSIHLGREVRVGEAYSFALGRLRKLFLTYLLVTLLLFGIVILVSIVGVGLYFLFLEIALSKVWAVLLSLPFWLALACIPFYAVVKLMLVDKVIIIEDRGYTDAIKRSWKLISGKAEGGWPRGYFLRLVILFNLFILINFAVGLLFQLPAVVFVLTLPQTLASIINQVLSNIGSVVASLFGSVCLVIFYYDIRNRKEGFDLEMLAGAPKE